MRKIDQFSLFAVVLAFTFGSSFAQGTKTEARTQKSSIVVPRATPAVTFHKIIMRVPPNAAIFKAKAGDDKTFSDENTLSGTQYDCGHPTGEEQYLLELINRARANPAVEGDSIAATTNPTILLQFQDQAPPTASQVKSEFAAYPSRPPLAFNSTLISVARGHSQDMLTNAYQSHTGSDGTSPFDRMNNAGYNSWTNAGENIFAYATDAYETHQEFLCDFGNYPDIGHRHNILNFATSDAIYNEIGVGVVHGSNGGVGPMLTTEDFGLTPAHFYITGVVYKDLSGNGFYDIGEGDSGVKITVSTGSSYYAISSGSGGYAIPMNSGFTGSVTVTASGGDFATPMTATVDFEAQNVKADFSPNLTGFPTPVTLIAPSGTLNTTTADLLWNAVTVSGVKYHLEIATNPQMTKPMVNDSVLTDTFFNISTLKDSTTYYWRVSAKNTKGTGLWSALDTFSVLLPPSPITLISPSSGANVGDSNVYFTWQPADKGAQNYWIILASDQAMKDTVFEDNNIPGNTSYTVDTSYLTNGGTYYWEVLAQNGVGWSPAPAKAWSFKLGANASVPETPELSSALSVAPNPANRSTKLSFTMDEPNDVSFVLYTSAGAVVESVELGMLPAGANTLQLDASRLESGVYECEVIVGGEARMARLVIVK